MVVRRFAATIAALLVLVGCSTSSTPPTATDATPLGYTIDATVEDSWFAGMTGSADVLLNTFDCDHIVAGIETAVLCGLGGTVERPFAAVVSESYINQAAKVPEVSLNFALYEPEHDGSGAVIRAVTVAQGDESFPLMNGTDSGSGFTLSTAVTAEGEVLILHYRYFGGPRTWNNVEVIGRNRHGSPAPVAQIDGEGVQLLADGVGLVYTNYQYLATESGCCYSYWAVRSLRPGTMGWTLTTRTVPVEDETWKRGLKPPYELATYDIPLMSAVEE